VSRVRVPDGPPDISVINSSFLRSFCYSKTVDKTKLKEELLSGHVALLVIDMQADYCSPGFYMDKAGYDIERLRLPIPNISRVLKAVRSSNIPIIYTRQYRIAKEAEESPVESALPSTSLKDEPGWEIVSELEPRPTDTVLDKTTCSVFVSSNLDKLLKDRSITTLIFCGNTFDVCVHSSLRTANDLGYKCITLGDCCGAVNDNLYNWSLESIQVEGGVFGSVINSSDIVETLK
jgi:biuret amidohydrolase